MSGFLPHQEFIVYAADHLSHRPQFAIGFDDLRFKVNHLLRSGIGVGIILDGCLNSYRFQDNEFVFLGQIGLVWSMAYAALKGGRCVRRICWPEGTFLARKHDGGAIWQTTSDGCSTPYTALASDTNADDWETVAPPE